MPNSWFMPQNSRDAADCIEHIASVISFLSESIAFSQDAEYHLSERGSAGLCSMLEFVGDTLMRCNETLLKEVA